MPDDPRAPETPPLPVWKRRLGLALILYSFVPLCTVAGVSLLPLSPAVAATVGAVYLASGELAFLAAAALLGKTFVDGIKARIKALLHRPAGPKRPPRPIGRWRHRVGVTLFCASVAPYYLALGLLLWALPGEPDLRTVLWLLLGGEAMFLAGLFMLGETFWERLKRLFEWPGNAENPS